MKGAVEDIPLQREDMVQISSIYDLKEEFYVKIFGEVKNSGTYPYHQQMSVEDLIVRAGGLRESASGSRVEVARRKSVTTEEGESDVTAEIFNFGIDRELKMTDEDKRFLLEPFDQVFIRKAPGYQQQISVKVEGEVLYPGHYVLQQKNERISDIIHRAGGLTATGYAPGATLIRRTEFNPPKSDEQIRLENLYELLQSVEKRTEDSEFILETEAEALQEKRLKNVEKELEEFNMSEDTEINTEGIRAKRQRLEELLERDSTVLENTAIRFETIGIELDRIIKNPGSKYDIILQEGDVLSVPRQLQTVRMRGEFLYPITVRYDQSLKFRNYVSKAGGFTQDAKRSKSYVLYANGSVDRTRKFLFFTNYPKIGPGAELIVPRKPERAKMSPQQWLGITTAFATLALIIRDLTR
jgi:protein involved in polysaccharide export with SLBB domain